MPQTSLKLKELTRLAQSVIRTLAFFSLYNLPVSRERLYELIDTKADRLDFEREVNLLISHGLIISRGSLVALASWLVSKYERSQEEIAKKKTKAHRYFGWLSLLPFVRQISFINSLAIGNADSESDIDFFVVTNPRRLYLVRSLIIVLFRLLGVYKTREKIANQFCFGFYISKNHLNLQDLQLKPLDPYFVFWLACMQPILGGKTYLEFIQANHWIYDYFPNFEPKNRLISVRKPNPFIRFTKFILELILWLPAEILEPLLRLVHTRHTFKLPENLSKTSTTVANKDMLKLHASDVRRDIAERFQRVLQSWG